MKRFKFTLEAVATLRRHAEQLALERFAQANLRHQQAIQELDQAQKEWERAASPTELKKHHTAGEWAQAQAWQVVLRQRIEAKNARVSETLRALEEANKLLTKSRQEREAVERVRKSRATQHEVELRRWEQKVLDELAQNQGMAQGLLNSNRL